MSTLLMKAVVTKPDGTLFYREEHEWTNVDPQMLAWFNDKMKHMNDFAGKIHGHKEDGANLTATLDALVDGASVSPNGQPIVYSGVSYHALVKFEREFHKVGGELLNIGDQQAKGKK